jgi:hypothetical protein
MDDGRTVYLRSDVLDLKNEKYIGNEVEVMGGITRTTDGNQTMLVESIDLIDPEAASAEEVPEWVDYVSENLGISLKYRSDYLLKELAGNIVVQPKPVEKNDDSGLKMENDRKSLAEISFSLLSRAEDFDLAKEMGINSWENSDVLAGGYNRSKVTQKAIDAFKKTMNGGKEIVYYLKNSDGSYKISFKAGETQEDFVSDQNMFYDILASVDFGEASGQVRLDSKETEVAVVEAHKDDVKSIDSNDDLSGFSTFTSDSQKFSIQYPKSYYFGVAPAKEGAAISYQFGVKPLEEVVGDGILRNFDFVLSVGMGVLITSTACSAEVLIIFLVRLAFIRVITLSSINNTRRKNFSNSVMKLGDIWMICHMLMPKAECTSLVNFLGKLLEFVFWPELVRCRKNLKYFLNHILVYWPGNI